MESLKYIGVNGRKVNKKLSLWAYRKLMSYIEYECLEKGVPLVKVNSKRTSKLCPRCNGKLTSLKGRIVVGVIS